MKTAFRLLVLMLLLVGWSLAGLALHVVYAPGEPGRLAIVPKDRLGIDDTWCDTRQWTAADLPKHAAVVQRLIETGKADILAHVVGGEKGDSLLKELQESVADGKTSKAQSNSRKAFFGFTGG